MPSKKSSSADDNVKKDDVLNQTEAAENTGASGDAAPQNDNAGEDTPVATSQQEEGEQNLKDIDSDGESSDKADAGDQETEESSDEEDGSEDEDVMRKLIAVCPILYLSHQYKVGDKLPANNPEMVQAWLDAGTAVWRTCKEERPKARRVTAEPGLPGQSVGSKSAGDDLIGKVPGTDVRMR